MRLMFFREVLYLYWSQLDAGRIWLTKGFGTRNRKLLVASACSIFLFTLTFLMFSVSPSIAQSGPVLQLTPSQGISGTIVSIYGLGFPSGGSVSIDFGSKHMTNGYPGMFGRINTAFSVPSVSPGVYTVTATGASGVSASATFTVTSVALSPTTGSGSTSTNVNPSQGSADTGSSFSFTSIPTQAPIKAKAGFWSPLAIAAVGVVVVIGILFPTVFIVRRRRQPEISTYDESPPPTPTYSSYGSPRTTSIAYSRSTPGSSATSYRASSINQQRKPTVSSTYRPATSYGNQVVSQRPVNYSRYTGTASYRPPTSYRNSASATRPGQPTGYSSPGSTKVCSHCKRSVKIDYSVCPYCRKRTWQNYFSISSKLVIHFICRAARFCT